MPRSYHPVGVGSVATQPRTPVVSPSIRVDAAGSGGDDGGGSGQLRPRTLFRLRTLEQLTDLSGQVREGRVLKPAVRQGESDDAVPGARDLPRQWPGVVGQAVTIEQVPDLRRDLVVAVAREIGEQVVLDLVGQVAGHQVHHSAPGDVGGTEHLSQVPLPLGLVLVRSEEHTSELQSRQYLVCRLLLEKKY